MFVSGTLEHTGSSVSSILQLWCFLLVLVSALFLSGISSQDLSSFFSTSPTSNIFWPLFHLSARLGNFPNDLEMDCSSAEGHVLSCPIPGHKS